MKIQLLIFKPLIIISTIIFFIMTINLPLIANNDKIEKIEKSLNEIQNDYKNKPRQCILKSNEIIEQSIKINYLIGEAEAYNLKGKSYDRLNSIDSSKYFYQKALDIYNQTKNIEGQAKIINNMGILFFRQNDYDLAEQFFKQNLKLRNKIGERESIRKAINNLALFYLKINKYDEALEYNFKLLDIYEKDNDNIKKANTIQRIGNIYYYMENYKDAIINYQNAIQLLENTDNFNQLSKLYTSLGATYYDMEEYDEALEKYLIALDFLKEKSDFGKSILLNNIGLIYKKKNEYQKALKYIKESLKERKDDFDIFHPLTSISEIYLKMNKPAKALLYLDSAEKIAKNINELNNFKGLYNLKYQAYQLSGNYQKALDSYKKYSDIRDSLLNKELQKTTTEIKVKYETEKKAEENKRLRYINKLQTTYFSVISGLVLIIMIVLYSRFRAKKKANELLREKNYKINKQHQELESTYLQLQKKEANLEEANATKDKFFAIIAHDLKNPIHAITLSAETLIYNFKKMDAESLVSLIKSIHKSGDHLSNLLENLLLWSRSQRGKISYTPIKTRINDLIENTQKHLDIQAEKKNITINNNAEKDYWIEIDPNMMQTVFRNLISNAVKFSNENGTIDVNITDNNSNLEVEIKDNGIGISEEDLNKLFRIDIHHTTIGTKNEAGTGLGLILCKEFIEKHGGNIRVDSKINQGSSFKFTIPKR